MDKGKDNLMFNAKKNVLWCHADPSHAPLILSEIMKKKERPKMQDISIANKWHIESEKWLLYTEKCNKELIAHDKALNYIFEHRGINPFTIKRTGMGYDFKTNKWVFPFYDMKGELKGIRYRGADLTEKSMWSEKGSNSFVACVYGKLQNENLYICEGEFDAQIMVQILEKENELETSTVVTPTMGVGNLKKCITDITFGNFENIYLCLDNDIVKRKIVKNGTTQDVSLRTTKELIELHPCLKDNTPSFTQEQLEQGNKDISDWWRLRQ
jgi:hypothetical protein